MRERPIAGLEWRCGRVGLQLNWADILGSGMGESKPVTLTDWEKLATHATTILSMFLGSGGAIGLYHAITTSSKNTYP